MSYGDQIAEMELVRAIGASHGRDGITRADAHTLKNMVIQAADGVGDLLAEIPLTFRQYTKHDILHARNVMDLMWRFIPKEAKKNLNGVELTVLALVALLHDLGMYVEEDEKQTIVDGDEFRKLLNENPEKQQAIKDAEASGKPYAAAAIRDSVLADYFRRRHPERALTNIKKYLPGLLRFRDYDLADTVGMICESHGWPVLWSAHPRKSEKTIGSLETSDPIGAIPFNPQYVAVCLRLADILDFDRSRTPLALLRTITDDESLAEWNKHLQIGGWTITDRDVSFHAKCDRPEHYVAVMEFLDLIDAELSHCRHLMRNQPRGTEERYPYNLPPSADRFKVGMRDASYLRGAFHFEIDYERIMKLLMDKSLYPDPSLFLRELLQNSLDACRVRRAKAISEHAAYEPRITVWDKSNDPKDPVLVFQDNGIGMSVSTIQKYFMRVGQSYYRSTEFESEQTQLSGAGVTLEAMSQFGIGFLSCFMVADRIKIETYNKKSEPLLILIEGPSKYLAIQFLTEPERPDNTTQGATSEVDGPPVFPGTRIHIHLRSATDIRVYEVLDRFAANVEIPVEIVRSDLDKSTMIPASRWEGASLPPHVRGEAFQAVSDESPLPPALLDRITPLFVPIDQYDFCKGLRGRLWFWMFSDHDGNPVPELGHLRIHSQLEVTGVPARAARVRSVYSNVHELLGKDGISRPRNAAALIPEADAWVSEFNRWWQGASDEQKTTVSEWLRKPPSRELWHAIGGLPEGLLSGDDQWAMHATAFNSSFFSILGPERLSFYGIDLPAGIIEWNPMRGTGRRVKLPAGTGYRIDVRTDVPRPAANRLFVDMEGGKRIGIPLLRALLRFGLEMLRAHQQNGADAAWKAWFDGVFSTIDRDDASMRYWKEVIVAERDLIRAVLPVGIVDGATVVEVPFYEAGSRFGQWMPIRHSGDSASAPWLRNTVRNRLLLFGHPIRQVDEKIEIDLMNPTADVYAWAAM